MTIVAPERRADLNTQVDQLAGAQALWPPLVDLGDVQQAGDGGLIPSRACILCYHVGMKKQALQYTIRGVPREVDRSLRRKAAQRKQSLNQVVLDELTMATVGSLRHEDFSDLVGKWAHDAAFDRILAAQRQIDWDQWK